MCYAVAIPSAWPARKRPFPMKMLPLYLLTEPPLRGFSPDDALQWLATDVGDDALAAAYRSSTTRPRACCVCSMRATDGRFYAFSRWEEVGEEMFAHIRARRIAEGAQLPGHQGMRAIVRPFMCRFGYEDASGWWHPQRCHWVPWPMHRLKIAS